MALTVVNYPTLSDDDFARIQSVRRAQPALHRSAADELRLDIPSPPHVGIANAPTPAACKVIVDALNADQFEIRGRVETVNVIGYDGKSTWTIESVRLADGDRDAAG